MAEEWHALSKSEVIKKVKSNEEGISDEEANLRIKKHGLNQIRKIHGMRPFIVFLKQFNSLLIYILIAAVIISALLDNILDAGVISAIIIFNSIIGFMQEYKAEKTIEKLREMLVPQAKVLRKGKLEKINAHDIVPGDILVFDEGDKIMADARLISMTDLEVNEAILTGESMPKEKTISALPLETHLADRRNMVFTGTGIIKGSGKAVVVATGMSTEFGKIAGLVQKVKSPKTPLQEKFDSFAKKLGIFIFGLCIVVAFIGILSGFDKIEMFLLSVSLAVSAIPEGLPAVIAISLALSVQRMSKVNALIRKLPAAETLGRTTVICTDKTGTITEEKMTVMEAYYDSKLMKVREGRLGLLRTEAKKSKELHMLMKIGCLCNSTRIEFDLEEKEGIRIGDPTEKALVEAAENAGLKKEEMEIEEKHVKEFSFSSARKMMSVVKEINDSKGNKGYVSYVKGSPEIILEKCSQEMIEGKIVELEENRKKILMKVYENMASRALRVLAFAFKEVRIATQNMAENRLVFVGFQGMLDPPRKEVREAIEKCRTAGIRIIMVTGDSALTAKAIASEIGLEGDVLSDVELEKLSEQELINALKEISIFARVTPEYKLKIIETLKKQDEIVAVTGDGVNDVLALKKADIGIAMGVRGTDVARDTSDMVLLDDNFASIVKSIHEGRRSYANIKKFTKFLLSVNFSEIGLILFSILMSLPLPLLPLQILWMNLVTDSFPALALGVEPAEKDIMQKKPRNPKEGMLERIIIFIIMGGIIALLTKTMVFLTEYHNGTSIDKIRTMVLTTAILFEMFFVFSCKSKKSILRTNMFGNKWLLGAVIFAVLLQIMVIYTPLNTAFRLTPLNMSEWAKSIAIASTGFVVFEIAKIVKEKLNKLGE